MQMEKGEGSSYAVVRASLFMPGARNSSCGWLELTCVLARNLSPTELQVGVAELWFVIEPLGEGAAVTSFPAPREIILLTPKAASGCPLQAGKDPRLSVQHSGRSLVHQYPFFSPTSLTRDFRLPELGNQFVEIFVCFFVFGDKVS